MKLIKIFQPSLFRESRLIYAGINRATFGQGSSYVRPSSTPAPKPPTPTPTPSAPAPTSNSSGGGASSSSSSSSGGGSSSPVTGSTKTLGSSTFKYDGSKWVYQPKNSGTEGLPTSSSPWNISSAQNSMTSQEIDNLPSGSPGTSTNSGSSLNFGQEGLPKQNVAPEVIKPKNPTFAEPGGVLYNTVFGKDNIPESEEPVKEDNTKPTDLSWAEWSKIYGNDYAQWKKQSEAYKAQQVEEPPPEETVVQDVDNPFENGTDAYVIFEQMKGLMNPFLKYASKREDTINDQKTESTDFINSQAGLKNDILMRQLASEQRKRDVGIQKVRGGTKAAEMALEEGRKRALRYLKGALAQRGAFGTTGTGDFSLAALTGQYDIKNAELKQKANESIMDLNMKFDDMTTQIQNNQLLNESEKTKLVLELNQMTANALDAIMRDLATQEVNLGTKAFDLGYQKELATEERDRQKQKELRDYFMKRLEMGEYVDPSQLAAVTEGDPVLEALATEAQRTGREYDSKAVTNVYENMLGAAWTTKVNPATGNTYKDEATNEVVRLVNEEGWTLEDALNRVRSAIIASPEYKAYQASLRSSGSSGGSSSKPTNLTYWTNSTGDNKAMGLLNGRLAIYDDSMQDWREMSEGELDQYGKSGTFSGPDESIFEAWARNAEENDPNMTSYDNPLLN